MYQNFIGIDMSKETFAVASSHGKETHTYSNDPTGFVSFKKEYKAKFSQAVIVLETATLDALGMVVDFSRIKRVVSTWINETLDHRMLLHKEDPILPMLKQRGELFYVMDANPTAENIAKLIFDHARSKGLPVVEVELWETPTSSASYGG